MILLLLMLMLMLMQGIEQIKGEVKEKGELKCVVCGTRRSNPNQRDLLRHVHTYLLFFVHFVSYSTIVVQALLFCGRCCCLLSDAN